MQRRFDWAIALGPIIGVLGCSDPVPNSYAVGLTLNLIPSGNCSFDTQQPDDIGNPPPNSSAGVGVGKRVYDGEGGLRAQCAVRSTGNGAFSVTASISSRSPSMSIGIDGGTVQANGMGSANFGISTQGLSGALATQDTPCTLTVIPAGDGLNIKAGAIWARFDCSKLQSPPTTVCQASGEIVLENCDK